MFLMLFGLWLIFNGRVTLEIVLTGLAVSGAVYAFACAFVGLSPKRELRYARRASRAFAYLAFLLKEIFKANFAVLRLIWTPWLEVEPELRTFRTRLRSDFGKVILANSITLTPGTITVHIRDDLFMVHCLDKEMGAGLEEGAFEKRIAEMEGEA